VDLRPGNVLKLPMPVKNPSTLSVEGHGLVRPNVVRSGEQKAAQLVESIPHPAEVL
jgi:flagellar motor switch protein FliM